MSDDPPSSPSSNPATETSSNPPNPADQDIEKLSNEQLWDQIGFHKPLAGFWYKLLFMLISLIVGIAITGVWYTYFYPYPESMGYKTAATGIFVLFFSIFDLGTNMTMERFIAEARIKNPARMIQYVQYFIWYQMTTGLIQTTAVSVYALFIVPRTELAYAVWIMLIQSTTQYPGFLGVFRGVLTSMQNFDKAEILNFVSGELIQRFTEVIFLIWGRWWGAQNPQIGELLGISIGAMIGLYIDDFFSMWLSAHYFSRLMAKEGITAARCFRVEFDWPLVKEALSFGIKTGLPGIIGLGAELIMLWEWLLYVPQYTTFVTLSGMAGGISGVMGNAMGLNITPAVSEAYLNGKQELTKYYIGQYARFAGLVQLFLLSILFIVLLVLEPVFMALGLVNYILAIPFIIPRIIRELQQPYTSLADTILTGTNHPTFLMLIRFGEEIMKVVSMTLFIVVLQLPDKYGMTAIIWIMPCGIYPAILFKTISIYIYVNKKIMHLKIPFWQAHGAPGIAAIIIYFIGLGLKEFVFDPISESSGIMVAVVITIVLIFIVMITVFFPLTALFGAWDTASLRDMKKAAKMSGPSRILVVPMYLGAELMSRISPLHNRFGMDDTIATQEARELLAIKHSHWEKAGIKNPL